MAVGLEVAVEGRDEGDGIDGMDFGGGMEGRVGVQFRRSPAIWMRPGVAWVRRKSRFLMKRARRLWSPRLAEVGGGRVGSSFWRSSKRVRRAARLSTLPVGSFS